MRDSALSTRNAVSAYVVVNVQNALIHNLAETITGIKTTGYYRGKAVTLDIKGLKGYRRYKICVKAIQNMRIKCLIGDTKYAWISKLIHRVIHKL